MRIILPKLHRLPTLAKADKSTQFLAQLTVRDPDVVLMNDIGLLWSSLPVEDQWYERSRASPLPPTAHRFSYNTHEAYPDQLTQWGGTGIVLMKEAKPRLFGKMGSDHTNLGRWTWAKIQGRQGHFLRVVSAYQPVKNTSKTGSSYQQQL